LSSLGQNHGFFDENLEFFEVSETTGINNSLILNFFERTGIDDSLILKYLKNRNSCFFQKSTNHPNTGVYMADVHCTHTTAIVRVFQAAQLH
jgi:hypothetical protein